MRRRTMLRSSVIGAPRFDAVRLLLFLPKKKIQYNPANEQTTYPGPRLPSSRGQQSVVVGSVALDPSSSVSSVLSVEWFCFVDAEGLIRHVCRRYSVNVRCVQQTNRLSYVVVSSVLVCSSMSAVLCSARFPDKGLYLYPRMNRRSRLESIIIDNKQHVRSRVYCTESIESNRSRRSSVEAVFGQETGAFSTIGKEGSTGRTSSGNAIARRHDARFYAVFDPPALVVLGHHSEEITTGGSDDDDSFGFLERLKNLKCTNETNTYPS